MVKVPAQLLRRLENLALSRPGIRKRRNRSRRRRSVRQQGRMAGNGAALSLTPSQMSHAAILQRPFTSSVPSGTGGFYDGEQGTYNRFHVDVTAGTAVAQTAYCYALYPNNNFAVSFAQTSSATTGVNIPGAYLFSAAVSPGFNTLTSVAQKQRALAAAIRMSVPSLSITTVTGEFCVGVISTDTFNSITAIDQLFTFAQGRGNVTRDLHEVRWYPGSFDSKYSTVSTTFSATGIDASDTNVVFVAVRGIPASTPVQIQATTITEWTPKPATGMLVSGASSTGTDHQQTVAVLAKHTPGWHHTAKATGERLLEDTVGQIGKAAEKWVPKMLQGGLAAFGL